MLRTLVIICFAIVLPWGVFSQKPDSMLVSRHRPGIMWFYDGLRSSNLVDARKYDRLVIDLVHDTWHGESQKAFQQHIPSIGWNAQFFFDIPLTPRNTVALGIGLGYGHTRIRYNQTLQRVDTDKTTLLADFPSGIDKSVFRSNKLFIPVELRFRTPGWRHVKLHVGGRLGYQFKTSSSLYSKVNGHRIENKTVGFYDLNPLSLSAHVRIGIRQWALTASYNFTPYFKTKQSAQLNGMEVGLSISLF